MSTQDIFPADPIPALSFRGTREAELFTREVAKSFKAVLAKNYVSIETDTMPAGFVRPGSTPSAPKPLDCAVLSCS